MTLICLAGSDVGGITTTATKSDDGKSWTINGEKKWVTQGRWATHALVGARTGPPGPKGLSVFMVPLNGPGISKRKLENSGVSSSGECKSLSGLVRWFLFEMMEALFEMIGRVLSQRMRSRPSAMTRSSVRDYDKQRLIVSGRVGIH